MVIPPQTQCFLLLYFFFLFQFLRQMSHSSCGVVEIFLGQIFLNRVIKLFPCGWCSRLICYLLLFWVLINDSNFKTRGVLLFFFNLKNWLTVWLSFLQLCFHINREFWLLNTCCKLKKGTWIEGMWAFQIIWAYINTEVYQYLLKHCPIMLHYQVTGIMKEAHDVS